MEKITHRNGAGYWVDFDGMITLPATPVQYLRRLELSNDVFGDDTHVEGVETGPNPYDNRIRISQPFVSGVAPDAPYLLKWLGTWGFEVVQGIRIGAYDALACRRGDVWLFDVRPKNFVLGPGEACYAIDVLVQHEDDDYSEP